MPRSTASGPGISVCGESDTPSCQSATPKAMPDNGSQRLECDGDDKSGGEYTSTMPPAMVRIPRLLSLLFLLVAPFSARAACNLQISMSCGTFGSGKTTACTTTTLNAGNSSCSGEYFAGAFGGGTPSQMQIKNFRTDLGLDDCFGSGDLPAGEEDGVFGFCSGPATLPPGGSFHTNFDVSLGAGTPE